MTFLGKKCSGFRRVGPMVALFAATSARGVYGHAAFQIFAIAQVVAHIGRAV
jgi:hypothetical protein